MSAGGLTNIEQCPYSPDLNMCDRFLLTRLQEHCRMHHYGSTEELKMDKSLFLRELEKLKSTAKLWFGSPESILLKHTIVCFVLFFHAYFCVLISRENIYGTYQVFRLSQTLFLIPS